MSIIARDPASAKTLDPRTALFCSRSGPEIFRPVAWPTDVWTEDPFDVESIHAEARECFARLLDRASSEDAPDRAGRVLLLKGESGSGKTHLMRAFRGETHRLGRGYFGYMQMTSSTNHYGRYILQKLIDSLDKPYTHSLSNADETTGLVWLSTAVCDKLSGVDAELEQLRGDALDRQAFGALVEDLADRAQEAPGLREIDLDVLRAMLALQSGKVAVRNRVVKYLRAETLSENDRQWLGGVSNIDSDANSLEMVQRLAKLMWATQRAPLVLCVDQLEDIFNAKEAPDKFRRAVEGLLQITAHVKSSVVVIACLSDYYTALQSHLDKSARDRLEYDPAPITLQGGRSLGDIKQIVGKHLNFLWSALELPFDQTDPTFPIPLRAFDSEVMTPARSVLKKCGELRDRAIAEGKLPLDWTLPPLPDEKVQFSDFDEKWSDHRAEFEPPPLDDETTLAAILAASVERVDEELHGNHEFLATAQENRLKVIMNRDGVRQKGGVLVGICLKHSKGGGLARQLGSLLDHFSGGDLRPVVVRLEEKLPGAGSQAYDRCLAILKQDGRFVVVNNVDWRMMAAYPSFHLKNLNEPGYEAWRRTMRPLGEIGSLRKVLDLDAIDLAAPAPPAPPAPSQPRTPLVEAAPPSTSKAPSAETAPPAASPASPFAKPSATADVEVVVVPPAVVEPAASPAVEAKPETVDIGELPPAPAPVLQVESVVAVALAPTPKPVSTAAPEAVRNEVKREPSPMFVGVRNDRKQQPTEIDPATLMRHAAFIGSTGSGKTTAALNLIEQLLLQGVPTLVVDRKGDLAAYAQTARWATPLADPYLEARRQRLIAEVDVVLLTPGHADGRPIRLGALPEGLKSLSSADRELAAVHAAHSLGAMLGYKAIGPKSQRISILICALQQLIEDGGRVTLRSLAEHIEENRDEIAVDLGRVDAKQFSGVAQDLYALRINNPSLFSDEGDPLDGDFLFGRGAHAQPGKTRLTIISTKFLPGNEAAQFWVAQLIMELTRWANRRPEKTLQAAAFFDEADVYLPAVGKPASKEPMENLLKRARSSGLGVLLGTQSPGDFDYKCRENINTWMIGRIKEKPALEKLRPLLEREPGDPLSSLAEQTMGEFYLVSEPASGRVKSQLNVVKTEQLSDAEILATARRNSAS